MFTTTGANYQSFSRLLPITGEPHCLTFIIRLYNDTHTRLTWGIYSPRLFRPAMTWSKRLGQYQHQMPRVLLIAREYNRRVGSKPRHIFALPHIYTWGTHLETLCQKEYHSNQTRQRLHNMSLDSMHNLLQFCQIIAKYIMANNRGEVRGEHSPCPSR